MFSFRLYLVSVIILIIYSKEGSAEVYFSGEHLHKHNNYIRANWESRYVTEGRDNLDGAGIQSTIINAEHEIFGLFLWNGWGYDSRYDELNIIPSLNYELNNFAIYLNYNHKQFFETDESDNEIGSGISYHGLPHGIFAGFDWYHSFESNGSFFELSFGSNFSPVQDLTLKPIFIFGINNNYIPDGHDGANHASLQLHAEYKLIKQLNITGYIGYNIAIDSDSGSFTGDELLNDFFWGSIGLELAF